MDWKANAGARPKPRQILPCGKRGGQSVHGHQSSPRAAKRQLQPEGCREQKIDFPGLNFLEITRGNLGFFGQLILGPTPPHPFAANIRTKHFNSFPLFLGDCHDTLHRLFIGNVNDTYIVKSNSDLLKENPNSNVLLMEGTR